MSDHVVHHFTPIVQGMKPFLNPRKRVRKCKIVGTLGPASSEESVLRALFEAGLDIVRLNFSHGSHEDHLKNIELVRRLAKSVGKNVSILQDLQGPKIRCGKLLNNQMTLKIGERYGLVFGVTQTDEKIIPIDYDKLVTDIQPGQTVMMDDGLLILTVKSIEKSKVEVEVVEGGILKSRKGVNFPDCKLSLPALTEKDTKDLMFGITHSVDMVALSFVQSPDDIEDCKKIIRAMGSDIPVIAKIEKLSGVETVDSIAAIADGLMVARGDLGVECHVERVPKFQRKIIEAAAKHSKPVIIATQMLESMVLNSEPTLAEVTDVANAVLEGADCVMLSAEVATGKHPVACVEKMASIIDEVESWPYTDIIRYKAISPDYISERWEEHEAIARAAGEAADSLGARVIVCLTLTGSIARLISKWRPKTPIIAISPRHEVIQRLGLTWGVYGMKNPLFYNTDVLLQDLPQLLKSLGIVSSGDIIVITAGIPINHMNSTNMIKINKID